MTTAAPEGAAVAAVLPRRVTILSANVYLSREICDTYFPGVSTIALVVRDERLLVIPLIHDSAGGMLLKVRNMRGDRVVHAQEFFRDKGFAEDGDEQAIAAHWSAEAAALVLDGVRRAPRPMQS